MVRESLGLDSNLTRLATQRAIGAEIEAEQALVNANRQLIRSMEVKVKSAIDRVGRKRLSMVKYTAI